MGRNVSSKVNEMQKNFPQMRKHFPKEFCGECYVILEESGRRRSWSQSAAHSTRQTSSLPWIIQRAVIDTNWNSLFTFDAHQLAGEAMTMLPSPANPNNWHFSNCTFAHMGVVGKGGCWMGLGRGLWGGRCQGNPHTLQSCRWRQLV